VRWIGIKRIRLLPAGIVSTGHGSAGGDRPIIFLYCLTCHDDRLETAGLRLDLIDFANVNEGAEVWEKVPLRSPWLPTGRTSP
jgi:hypothetical protein